jgi:hypothetical protein
MTAYRVAAPGIVLPQQIVDAYIDPLAMVFPGHLREKRRPSIGGRRRGAAAVWLLRYSDVNEPVEASRRPFLQFGLRSRQAQIATAIFESAGSKHLAVFEIGLTGVCDVT